MKIVAVSLLVSLALLAGIVLGFTLADGVVAPVVTGAALPTDARFIAIGRSYGPALLKAQAQAYGDGAVVLDMGGPVEDSIAAVAKSWTDQRQKLHAALLGPELAKIVPEGADPKTVTPAQRAAMAAAFRGFAKGVGP